VSHVQICQRVRTREGGRSKRAVKMKPKGESMTDPEMPRRKYKPDHDMTRYDTQQPADARGVIDERELETM